MDAYKTGKIIAEGRKRAGLTQKDLAQKLYISDKAISKWERGLCFPDITLLIPLTEILNVSLYELLKGEIEEMNKNDYENVLKETIDYSNKSVKKSKRRFFIVSAVLIALIVISSFITIAAVKRDMDELGAITDRDTVYGIEHYSADFTDLSEAGAGKIENILSNLPLKWYERVLVVNGKQLEIRYTVSFDEVIKAYKDEHYVKLAMLDIPAVLFTAVNDAETVNIRFADCRFTAKREAFEKLFGTDDFSSLADKAAWEKNISNKLSKEDFVEDNFKTLERYKETLEQKIPVADK